MMEARIAEWERQLVQDGREAKRSEAHQRLLAAQRDLLLEQVRSRFDEAAASRLRGLLDGIADTGKLTEVGRWIVTCKSPADILQRLSGAA